MKRQAVPQGHGLFFMRQAMRLLHRGIAALAVSAGGDTGHIESREETLTNH